MTVINYTMWALFHKLKPGLLKSPIRMDESHDILTCHCDCLKKSHHLN